MAQIFDLHDKIQLVKLVMYGIWRKRWVGLVTAWVICGLSWGLVLSTPYTFKSQAVVAIDSSRILPSIASKVRSNVSKNKRTNTSALYNKLATPEKLGRIIQRTDFLDRLATTNVERARMVAELRRKIRIRPLQGEDVYEISYQNNDARLSANQRAKVTRDVVMLLLNEFIDTRVDDVDNSRGIGFYEDQIKAVQAELESLDKREGDFVGQYGDFLGDRDSFRRKIDAARRDLATTENELGERRAEMAELEKSLQEVPPTLRGGAGPGGRRGPAKDPLQERIDELEKNLDKLKISGKTDKHPDVRAVQRQIDDLVKELEAKKKAAKKEQEEAKKAGTIVATSNEQPNPVFERLTISRFELGSAIKRLETRQATQAKTLDTLESKSGEAPEIKNRYDRLLLEKRDKLRRLSELNSDLTELQQASDASKASDKTFTIQQEPTVPSAPSSQARIYFFAGGLLFSMVAGIAVALVFSVIRPTIISVDQLRSSYDLPILGSVTMTYSEDQMKSKSLDLLVFGAGAGLLFLIFLVLSLQDIL